MRSKQELTEIAFHLAHLIVKHGGWLDENDSEVVRFPSPHAMAHAMAQFFNALEADKSQGK